MNKRFVSKLGKLYDIATADNGYIIVLDHDRDVDPMKDAPCVACVVFNEEDIEDGVKKYENEEGYDRNARFFLVNGIKHFARDIVESTGHNCFGDLDIGILADVFEVFSSDNEGKSFNTESLKAALAEAEYECYMRGYIDESLCDFYKVTETDKVMKEIIDWNYEGGAWDTDIFTDGWKEDFKDIDGTIEGMESQIEDFSRYCDDEDYINKGRNLITKLKALKH